jgi:hypothetical protein
LRSEPINFVRTRSKKHKARKSHFASASTVFGRGVSRVGTSASTVSGRVIYKHFSADNLFEAKDNHFCENTTGSEIYFSSIGNIKDPRSDCDKGYKCAQHEYFTKIVQKFHMTLTLSAANLNIFSLKISVSIFGPKHANAIFKMF